MKLGGRGIKGNKGGTGEWAIGVYVITFHCLHLQTSQKIKIVIEILIDTIRNLKPK